jgi:hypothetical protein
MTSLEISKIDLRYEKCRLQDHKKERLLLSSISQTGIHEPLWGVMSTDSNGGSIANSPVILLDGFKRLRCGKKLGITTFPFHAMAKDEASGILQLLRIANNRSLNLLEQASFVDHLKNVHGFTVGEIAKTLECSSSWVGARVGIITEIPKKVLELIFAGQFPASSYLYTLRHIRRLTAVPPKDIEEFVTLVSSKGLSTRDIESLARAFFQGSDKLRQQIREGNLTWFLEQGKNFKKNPAGGDDGNAKPEYREHDARLLRDLEILHKYISRFLRIMDKKQWTTAIHAEGNLLSGGIKRLLPDFHVAIEEFYQTTLQIGSNDQRGKSS